MKRICVFCGSGRGSKPEYSKTAKKLGKILAENNIGLVYGGAKVGLMGEIAAEVLNSGGDVIGIIPENLANKNVALTELKDLRVVKTMHERKALMVDLSDGFIAMPGGLGTIEEIFEVFTWSQLGLHKKPCGFLNVANYYDDIIKFLKHAVDEKFIRKENFSTILVDDEPENLLQKFYNYSPATVDKAKWALELLHGEEAE